MPVTCDYDRGRLEAWLRLQCGVIARWQALECGLTTRAIEWRLRPGGQWRAYLPGVYMAHTGRPDADQRHIAALLYAGPDSALTGPAAVRRHSVECAGLNMIDVLVPLEVQRKSVDFVRMMRTAKMPSKVYKTGAIRFVPPARAVADAARQMTDFGEVQAVVCSAVQRGRCTPAMLIAELAGGPRRGSRLLRLALAEVGDGVRSKAEGDLRRIIIRSGLEPPLYNVCLYAPDGEFIAKPDAWWQRAGVAGEVDSRQYHLKAADYRETALRHNRMERYGINVQHWLPSVIADEPEVVVRDIREALESGRRRPALEIVTKVDGKEVPLHGAQAGTPALIPV